MSVLLDCLTRHCPLRLIRFPAYIMRKHAIGVFTMSNTDSFIDEVTEEVRSDRLWGYAKKYGWLVGLGLLLVVGGTAYFEFQSSKAEQMAQDRGDAILAALATDEDGRDAALRDLAADDQTVVTRLLAATGDDAVANLQAIQNDADAPGYLRDLASLRLAALRDALSDEERLTILQDQSSAGRLYRSAALDYLVLLHLEQGNTDQALTLMQDAIQDAATDRGQINRFVELIVAMGETPALAN
ncbi:MAG: hypothetical protein ACPG5U_06485 [Planktomarina sp.]